jgi:hypothetical protein
MVEIDAIIPDSVRGVKSFRRVQYGVGSSALHSRPLVHNLRSLPRWTAAGQHIHRKPGDFDTLTGLLPTLDRQELRRAPAPALSSHLTHLDSAPSRAPSTMRLQGASPSSARMPAASSPAPRLLRLVPRRRH